MKSRNMTVAHAVQAARGLMLMDAEKIVLEKQKNGLYAVATQSRPSKKTTTTSIEEEAEDVNT